MAFSFWGAGDRLTREAVQWFGAAFMLMVGVAAAAVAALGYGPAFSLVCLGAITLFGITAVRQLRDYHPYRRMGGANAVTIVRMWLACLLAGLATELDGPDPQYSPTALAAVATALGAICLDGLDGFLARRQRMASRFGARFDMEVDAFLLLVLSCLVWSWGKAGVWVLAIGAIHYSFFIAGLIWPPLRAELPPSMRRKAICAVQGGALCIVLSPLVGRQGGAWIVSLALAALCVSFAMDLAYLVALHRRERHRNA